MSNASMTPVRDEENKESDQKAVQNDVQKNVDQVRYPEDGCRIDGHQGYGCNCNPIRVRPQAVPGTRGGEK